MRFDTLQDALIHELQDLYSAEKQLLAGLPKMIAQTQSKQLKAALEMHLEETNTQKNRLEEIFSLIGTTPQSELCEAMRGLMEEGDEILQADGDPMVKDAMLIGAAQRIEHYEMAGYGTARAFAKSLGLDKVADLLQETLDEEGAANKKLSAIAEDGLVGSGVNTQARESSTHA